MDNSLQRKRTALILCVIAVVLTSAVFFAAMVQSRSGVAFAMDLYVQIKGEENTVLIEVNDYYESIAELKARIAASDELGNPSVESQTLTFDDTILNDEYSIIDYSIDNGSILLLTIATASADTSALDEDPGTLVAFYNYDGSLIAFEHYTAQYGLEEVPSETVVPDPSWGWTCTGWRCNACGAVVDGSNVDCWVGNNPGHMGAMNDDSVHGDVSLGFTAAYNKNGNNVDNITFEPVIATTDADTVSLGVVYRTIDPKVSQTVTVNYNIANNDGVHALFLIPEYDTVAFTLTSANVVTKNDTILGAATITGTQTDASEIKVVWENVTNENENAKYNDLTNAFLSLTFTVNNNAIANGMYDFGLKLHSEGENSSAYYYVANGEQIGEHVNVPIMLKRTSLLYVTRRQDAEITIGYNRADYDVWDPTKDPEYFYDNVYVFEYSKEQISVERVDSMNDYNDFLAPENYEDLVIYYTYTAGDTSVPLANIGNITYTWYRLLNSYDGWEELQEAPATATYDTYKLEITIAESARYYETSASVYFTIRPRTIYVDIDDKSSAYGEPIVALTYTASSICAGDTLQLSITTSATSSSSAGTYPISGSVVQMVGSYIVIFRSATNPDNSTAVYTITKKTITITAGNQSAQFTGSEPTVNQNEYSISGDLTSLQVGGVYIVKEPGVNVGSYDLTPAVSNPDNNYDYSYVKGTFTITSIGYTSENIQQYFQGRNLVYNGQSQFLINYIGDVAWLNGNYSYDNNDAYKTNVGNYVVTVYTTLSSQDAANYTNGEQIYLTVNSSITPASVTLSAENKSHYYGSEPASLTYAVTSGEIFGSDDLNVNLAVKNGANSVTLSRETNVGEYDIVLSASNGNYNITKNNAVYTVYKVNPTIEVTASDVYYNRQLDYTSSAKAGNINLTPTYKFYSDENCTIEVTPENVGTYYIKAVIAETDNYYGANDVDDFDILLVQLASPVLSYNGATVTLSVVSKDCYNVDLKSGTVVTYYVNGVACDENRSFTATGTALDGFTFTVSSNNANYTSNNGTTAACYALSYAGGEHPLNSDTPANIPQSAYAFAGQSVAVSAAEPTLYGYTFAFWSDGSADYLAEDSVVLNSNVTLNAVWDVVTFTVTFKYTETSSTANVDVFEAQFDYKDKVSIPVELGMEPVKTGAGIVYTFNNTWGYQDAVYATVEGFLKHDEDFIIVTDNSIVIVAQYDEMYQFFNINYYVADDEAATGYTLWESDENIAFATALNLRTVESMTWFRVDAWYTNEARTSAAPTKMPAYDLDLYAGYVFDIGHGDVSGNGIVNADDITLYRRWIVGGYTMNVVEAGTEFDLVQNGEYDENAIYFLKRVADINADQSRDVRDVSITRMALVGGYYWDIASGEAVTGADVIRNVLTSTFETVNASLAAGRRTTLYSNIESASSTLDIVYSGNLYLDLNGNTLTLNSVSLLATGKDATIVIKNGTISVTEGITIAAPNGNVVIEDVVTFVNGSQINLQAADSSLHFNGAVEFYEGNINDVVPTPATVNIEEGTHVVLEQNAEVVIEKIVVTENNFAQVAVAPAAVITLDNKTETIVEVEGKVGNAISDFAALDAVKTTGGEYVLYDNIIASSDIVVTADLSINLNGYSITFADWGFEVRNGATLTISGTGVVSAVEAPLYAQYAGKLVINGGTYVATNNFVIATNGSANRGGNYVTINGGTFNGSIAAGGYVACGVYVANSDVVTINAGTFNITNGVGVLARSGNTTIGEDVVFNVTGNGTAGKIGDSRIVVPTGDALVVDLAANYPAGEPVLTNNSDYDVSVIVENVADIEAVKNTAAKIIIGNNINTESDIVISSDLIVDLNGQNITFASWGFEVRNGATLTFNGNGTVSAVEAPLYAQYAGKLVINGGTYVSTNNFVVATNGSANRGGNYITINGGTFIGSIAAEGYVACGVYVANSDVVTINAGTFNITNGVGVLARSGNTTIGEDVVFNVTGNGTAGKIGDSRVVVPAGEALVLDMAANYPAGDPAINNNTEYSVYTISAN